jgi:hypothetical protein
MSTSSNPFAALLDPVGILAMCANSGALDALPLSKRHSADRQSLHVAGELAEHDAAVEAIFHGMAVKAAKAPAAKPKASRRAASA